MSARFSSKGWPDSYQTALHKSGARPLQGQAARDRPLLPPGKHIIQLIVFAERAMQVLVAGGRLGKAAVEVRHERRQEGIARLKGRDPSQTQLLDQPVLQGAIGALHAAFGL